MRKYMNYTIGRKNIFNRARFEIEPGSNDAGDEGHDLGAGNGGGSSEEDNNGEASLESLKAQLATAKAEAQRFKNSIDKLTKEKSELNKKANSLMTAEQKAQEIQEERDKRFAEMEKELRTNKYSKRLVSIGMKEEDADAFAATIPELEDSDAFFTTLNDFIAAKEKAASERAIQDLLKSRPDINAGNGDKEKDDPAMQLAKMAVEANKGKKGGVNSDIINRYL